MAALTTSKGNQVKYREGDFWYKFDHLGYEALAESVCSAITEFTNVKDFVSYELLQDTNTLRVVCKSRNFLQNDETLVTADRLLRLNGVEPTSLLGNRVPLRERISRFVCAVEDLTGIIEYGAELTRLLEWDSFVLNDDRHLNNIAFVWSEDTQVYRPSPWFDNGAAFMSDTLIDYPMTKNTYGLMAGIKAKPFSESFTEQVRVCKELYGAQLRVDSSVCLPESVLSMARGLYTDGIVDRVVSIFERQVFLSDYVSKRVGLGTMRGFGK